MITLCQAIESASEICARLASSRAEDWKEDGLIPAVFIIEPNNVIFAQVAAGLDFNQFKRDFAWVSQPVNAADRNVGRFVFMDDATFSSDCHFRSPPHHDPMLRAMEMLLQ